MLIDLYTDKHDEVCVQDFGIDNIIDADGLAVGRPSGFVGKRLKSIIDGVFTVFDATMYRQLALMADHENIFMEPSAMAGLPGIMDVMHEIQDTPKRLNYILGVDEISYSQYAFWLD